MSSNSYTFEQLPSIVAMLADEIKALRAEIQHNNATPKEKEDEMMDLKGLRRFHPEHPAAPTIYKWVRTGQIPYYKTGKKLIFKKSGSMKDVRGQMLKLKQMQLTTLTEGGQANE
ncbi:MAG: helix-turn-helix domain-containing protein [Bacteroidales bacterium]|nr:helix-turn-helix domain-containing protein [Bacteroidales bacterium]